MAVQIVYETHSTTTDNANGIATGWLPGRLSERGRAGARELGERRRHDEIDVIYVSDLERALETVHIAFDGGDIPVVIDARLRECNYGRLNGMPSEVLQRERATHVEVPWPEGESYLDVVARTRGLLNDIASQLDGQRVLFIAHSANRWALQTLIDGRELADVVTEEFDWQPGWEFTLDRLLD